jgi:hypothetical protein
MHAKTLSALWLLVGLTAPAAAQQFQFMPAPQTDLNRIYRVDRTSGEVGACQYALKEGSVGVTLCFGAGEGAGPQPAASDFALISSRHDREGGIYRVDNKTGAMSICYVYDDLVVCTAPEKGPPPASAAAPATTPQVDTTASLPKKN